MQYNWQQSDWPHFSYEIKEYEAQLLQFVEKQGIISGLSKGLSNTDAEQTLIDIMISEAMKTSEIEGEFLSRQDVLSSIRNNLGLNREPEKIKDKRAGGIAKLMVTARKYYKEPLSKKMLFEWHKAMMKANATINLGQWRNSTEPMQVISGSYGKEIIHFEAPPSKQVSKEMDRFIEWFNNTAPDGSSPIIHAPIRSAIAHVYFESIHPFEDGNGRIGRAISEKALSQGLKRPILLSLSKAIESNRQKYYSELKTAQSSNNITAWIKYFLRTIFQAQNDAENQINFTLRKSIYFNKFIGQLNPRQEKVLQRMLAAGPNGFEGGMNAKKYLSITKTSKATATRDLQNLVKIGALLTEKAGRATRYHLSMRER